MQPNGKAKGAKALLAHAVIAQLQAEAAVERTFIEHDNPDSHNDYGPLASPQSRSNDLENKIA